MIENAERFTGRVEDYERYRLRYPFDVIRILRDRSVLRREDMVADVGSGTGMLSELFLENGNAVVAVEPNDEMRASCEKLASAWPGFTVKKGTAEATGLGEASVDVVAVGRAFHWFDAAKSKTEFQRILRPAGWVVLVSYSRARDDSAISVDYEGLLCEHGTDYAENRERYENNSKVEEFFAGGELHREEIFGEQRLTLEQLAGQTQSLSVTPAPGHAKYEGMQAGLRELFLKWQVDGVVSMNTILQVAWGRLG